MIDSGSKNAPHRSAVDDAALVAALAADGRMTTKEVALRIGAADAAVATRIRELIDSNVIRVVAQRDYSRVPGSTVKAIIELYLSAPSDMEMVATVLDKFDEVVIAYETARRPELCCNVRVTDIASLDRLANAIACGIPTVAQMNVLPILAIHRLRRTIVNLQVPRKFRAAPADLEGLLIHELERDGRQPVSQLARTLGLSPTATRYRMEKLLKNGDYAIRLLSDAKAMGYSIWADLRLTIRPDGVASAIERFTHHKDVITIAHLSGIANLMVFVVARDVIDLDAFVQDEVRNLPGLRGYEIMRVPRVVKYDFNSIFS